MNKDDAYNKNSMSYIPTYEEMGLPQNLIRRMETEYEDEIKTRKNNLEYDAYMQKWQNKHRADLSKKIKQKKERRDQNFAGHWFIIKTDAERMALIEETRSLVDEVMDDVIKSIRINSLIVHAETLRIGVKRAPISLFSASNDKLRRFPSYSLETNSLEGSSSSFYRLWSHVFRITKTKRFNPRR